MSCHRARDWGAYPAGAALLLALCALVGCERCIDLEADKDRRLVISRIRQMQPLSEGSATDWLMGVAGWNSAEVAYFNLACAMPIDGSRGEWLALSPSSFERFQRAWHESVLSGVEVRSILIRDDGVARWNRDARAQESADEATGDTPLAAAIREGLQDQVQLIADCLELGRFEQSRRVLREGVPGRAGR